MARVLPTSIQAQLFGYLGVTNSYFCVYIYKGATKKIGTKRSILCPRSCPIMYIVMSVCVCVCVCVFVFTFFSIQVGFQFGCLLATNSSAGTWRYTMKHAELLLRIRLHHRYDTNSFGCVRVMPPDNT